MFLANLGMHEIFHGLLTFMLSHYRIQYVVTCIYIIHDSPNHTQPIPKDHKGRVFGKINLKCSLQSSAWCQVLRSDCLSIYETFRPRGLSRLIGEAKPRASSAKNEQTHLWDFGGFQNLSFFNTPQLLRPEWKGWGVKGELHLKAVRAAWEAKDWDVVISMLHFAQRFWNVRSFFCFLVFTGYVQPELGNTTCFSVEVGQVHFNIFQPMIIAKLYRLWRWSGLLLHAFTMWKSSLQCLQQARWGPFHLTRAEVKESHSLDSSISSMHLAVGLSLTLWTPSQACLWNGWTLMWWLCANVFAICPEFAAYVYDFG